MPQITIPKATCDKPVSWLALPPGELEKYGFETVRDVIRHMSELPEVTQLRVKEKLILGDVQRVKK